jgi:hypothetical protein
LTPENGSPLTGDAEADAAAATTDESTTDGTPVGAVDAFHAELVLNDSLNTGAAAAATDGTSPDPSLDALLAELAVDIAAV